MFSAGPYIEVELVGDLLLHFDKVGQEQKDLHLVVGQVSATADALSPLDVRPTQQNHNGPLVDVLWSEPGDNPVMSQSTNAKPKSPERTSVVFFSFTG